MTFSHFLPILAVSDHCAASSRVGSFRFKLDPRRHHGVEGSFSSVKDKLGLTRFHLHIFHFAIFLSRCVQHPLHFAPSSVFLARHSDWCYSHEGGGYCSRVGCSFCPFAREHRGLLRSTFAASMSRKILDAKTKRHDGEKR